MRRKLLIAVALFVVLYLASYVLFRNTHAEVWEKDKNVYVIFPQDKILYYMYRPISMIDGKLTGMRFHIGNHQ